jgi:putative ATP-dependent endonuclease of the OLD family
VTQKTNLLQLQEEDFHLKNTSLTIKITVTFCDLSPEARTDFKHYFRNGELVVSAVANFSQQSGRAEVVQHGSRMVMREFVPFFDLLNAKALVVLKPAYAAIRSEFPDLPVPGTKDAMIAALHDYEESHPERCTLIESPAEFYGFSKGASLLEKYVEWIYVPAVKDASTA